MEVNVEIQNFTCMNFLKVGIYWYHQSTFSTLKHYLRRLQNGAMYHYNLCHLHL